MEAPNITRMSAQVPLKDYDRGRLDFFYETMLKIRKFERTVEENFLAGNIPGFVHLYIGEEAVASVGLSEEEAVRRGHRVRVGRFPLAGNGKSIITGDAVGMVKIVSDERYDEVLGVHMAGGPATDMIAEGGLALRLEATLEELVSTIHPHPTVSEAFPEAAMATWGQAIHFPPA